MSVIPNVWLVHCIILYFHRFVLEGLVWVLTDCVSVKTQWEIEEGKSWENVPIFAIFGLSSSALLSHVSSINVNL